MRSKQRKKVCRKKESLSEERKKVCQKVLTSESLSEERKFVMIQTEKESTKPKMRSNGDRKFVACLENAAYKGL